MQSCLTVRLVLHSKLSDLRKQSNAAESKQSKDSLDTYLHASKMQLISDMRESVRSHLRDLQALHTKLTTVLPTAQARERALLFQKTGDASVFQPVTSTTTQPKPLTSPGVSAEMHAAMQRGLAKITQKNTNTAGVTTMMTTVAQPNPVAAETAPIGVKKELSARESLIERLNARKRRSDALTKQATATDNDIYKKRRLNEH
jgi:hypothetical protein